MTALSLTLRPAGRWRVGAVLSMAVAAALALYASQSAFPAAGELPRWQLGFLASLVAGMATGLGALPVLFAERYSERAQGLLLGFGAGVMLAASAFSLILPGIEAARAQLGTPLLAVGLVSAGVGAGGLFLYAADRLVPHEHFVKGVEGMDAGRLRRVWLFVFAIALHNLPEGLAVGVSYGGEEIDAASRLALGIALQNMPEGLVVAIALVSLGYARLAAVAIALGTGLVEPLGSALGAGAVTAAHTLLPWGLAFAAGAMLYVASHEILPESHRNGHAHFATLGVMSGFLLMTILSSTVGQ